MLLTCPRAALTNAFLAVSGVVPSRTTKEILKNVKLQVTGTTATLIGTDGEIGMRCVWSRRPGAARTEGRHG